MTLQRQGEMQAEKRLGVYVCLEAWDSPGSGIITYWGLCMGFELMNNVDSVRKTTTASLKKDTAVDHINYIERKKKPLNSFVCVRRTANAESCPFCASFLTHAIFPLVTHGEIQCDDICLLHAWGVGLQHPLDRALGLDPGKDKQWLFLLQEKSIHYCSHSASPQRKPANGLTVI